MKLGTSEGKKEREREGERKRERALKLVRKKPA